MAEKNCEICNHKKHRAGDCQNCNCGESEICRPLERYVISSRFSDRRMVEMQGKLAVVEDEDEATTRY